MYIHDEMNLDELKEVMSCYEIISDDQARRMRALLCATSYETTYDVEESEWFDLMRVACQRGDKS